MEKLLVDYFKGILTEPNIQREEEITNVCQYIPKKVTRDQNLALLRVITKEKVEEMVRKNGEEQGPEA